MSTRRRLDRERLEVLLLYLLLRYRQIILIGGEVVLLYAVAMIFWYPQVAIFAAALAFFLLSLALSYQAALYTARFGAWLAFLWKREE